MKKEHSKTAVGLGAGGCKTVIYVEGAPSIHANAIAFTVPRKGPGTAETIAGVEANAALISAAWNASVEINPNNPLAAAEAMPEIFRLLLAVVSDARKICGKKLDLEEWLRQADAAVDKATKGAA